MTAVGLSLSELTAAVEQRTGGRLAATVIGSPATRVSGLAPLARAGAHDLSFLANPHYRADALTTRAAAVVLGPADRDALLAKGGDLPPLVVVDHPYAWFAHAAQLLHPAEAVTAGIVPGAFVSAGARIDPSACVEAGAVVGDGAEIGARVWIGAGAVVGARAAIGAESRLHPRAVLLDGCRIGARCIVHSGAVIGADGFGFAPLDGRWIKIPQVGGVVVGDDVEIGANTTIDRGSMGDTIVEDGVKLDNQIQVGHNCTIGAHTVIAGCVGIAGSAHIGRGCQIGGAAMIAGHLSIADGSAIGPGTLVASSITEAGHYTGFFPLMRNRDWQRAAAIIRQLEDMRDRLRKLESERDGGQGLFTPKPGVRE
ncbi:MAG TPA: UDP-3-O-(3-hydroxymyristoyl)glucosamine N-acyltransferase [Sinorhizobium sp.]|nr:UDP-3-O-(3-hydroxymyristoyl)glucosamine N-acyltransferase [Sinorhizobium sp.]